MGNERSYRVAALLVSVAALLIILERVWNFIAFFQDLLLLFALAWLISFTLAPVIDWFKRPFWPHFLYTRFYAQIDPLHRREFFPHNIAVIVVYLTLVILIILGTSSIIPTAIEQSTQLSQQLPTLPDRVPKLIEDLQRQLASLGVNVDLRALYESSIVPQLNQLGTSAVRDLLSALSVVAATVSNLVLVIILSLYMNLGGRTLSEQLAALMPRRYRREVIVFAQSINKTFGGFMRGQLIQALLVGIGTALVMVLLNLKAVILGAVLAALLMLIPFIGALLALLPPVLIAIFQSSLTTALIVFVLLFIFQQILVNAIMPKILADSVGLHPLLIFAALLMGIRIGGVWGAFFGIPVAGVIYAMLTYFSRRLRLAMQERKNDGSVKPAPSLEDEHLTTHTELDETATPRPGTVHGA